MAAILNRVELETSSLCCYYSFNNKFEIRCHSIGVYLIFVSPPKPDFRQNSEIFWYLLYLVTSTFPEAHLFICIHSKVGGGGFHRKPVCMFSLLYCTTILRLLCERTDKTSLTFWKTIVWNSCLFSCKPYFSILYCCTDEFVNRAISASNFR